jgi:NhaP-type Na+/H+ or K+/H+ antiporter
MYFRRSDSLKESEQAVSEVEFVALVLAAIGPVLALAGLLRVPASLVLFGLGLAAAFVPGLPALRADPHLLLGLFLPPIIYASTVQVSFHLLRFTLLPGVLLGGILSFLTIGAVTIAARTLLPGLPWLSALLLGVTAAVFDTRLFHEAQGRPHVPRAIADTMKAREMASRIVVLSCFALALEALTKGPPSMVAILGSFAYDIVGGALVGAAIGRAVLWLRERVDPAPVEIAISVATPYLGALAAQRLGLSVAVVIMSAALVISAVRIDRETGAPRSTSEARLTAMAFWEQASLMLSAVLFFLAGRALPEAMGALGDWPIWTVAVSAMGLLAVILAIQYTAGLAATALPAFKGVLNRTKNPTDAPRTGTTGMAVAGVMTWASTRSVIGLILALSIPATLPDGRPFAERELILVVTALIIVGSILVQGLTLRPAVRNAALGGNEEEQREQRLAEQAMAEVHDPACSTRSGTANAFDAERRALLALREKDAIGDEMLRRMLRETDLRSRATEKSALPGAGPPNP